MNLLQIDDTLRTTLIITKSLMAEIDAVHAIEKKRVRKNVTRNDIIEALLKVAIAEYKKQNKRK